MVFNIRIYTVFVLMLAVCGGCGKNLGTSPAGPAPVFKEQCISLPPAEANNKFAMDMYNRLGSDDSNIFFSPFSISSALAMTYEGARGRTANEIQKVFYLLTDDTERWSAYEALFDSINGPDKAYKLYTSNNLWLEQTIPFRTDYLDTVTQSYGAGVKNLDFIGDPDGSRLLINETVADQTDGRITDLFPQGVISPQTRLVLTNAIYFKADWLNPFDAEDTRNEFFYPTPDNPILVPTMFQRTMGTIEDFDGKAQVMELPYVDREVSMFIFLPAGGMAVLEQSLLGGRFDSWMSEREGMVPPIGMVDLALPKFEFETTYKEMKVTLSEMGMPTAFTPGAADFTGIIDINDLYISTVIHKAFVAVDEKGTEAAAATGVVGEITSVPPPATPFRVNRPFIFIIRENAFGTVLFMGRVNNPIS